MIERSRLCQHTHTHECSTVDLSRHTHRRKIYDDGSRKPFTRDYKKLSSGRRRERNWISARPEKLLE